MPLDSAKAAIKRPALLGFTLFSVSLWIFTLIVWEKLSLICLTLSPEALQDFSTVSRFVLELPVFLKILCVLLVVLLQIMLCGGTRLRYSEKVLINAFSTGFSVVCLLWGYRFLILPLLSYNQSLRSTLSIH